MNLFEITLDQHMDMIEYAGNMLDKHDLIDSSAPSLVEVCEKMWKTIRKTTNFYRNVLKCRLGHRYQPTSYGNG